MNEEYSDNNYKRIGCVVWDKSTHTVKGLHIPVVLDMITDRVRLRAVGITIFMVIFTMLAYNVLNTAFRGPRRAATDDAKVVAMQVNTNFQSKSYFGVPIPRISVTLYDVTLARVANKEVTLRMYPAMDRYQKFSLAFNMPQIDSHDLVNYYTPTYRYGDYGDYGVASFTDLMVVNGAPGVHIMEFSCDGAVVMIPVQFYSHMTSASIGNAYDISAYVPLWFHNQHGSNVTLFNYIHVETYDGYPVVNRSLSLVSFTRTSINSPRYRKHAILDVGDGDGVGDGKVLSHRDALVFGPTDANGDINFTTPITYHIPVASADDIAFALCTEGLCVSLHSVYSHPEYVQDYDELRYFKYHNDVTRIEILQQPSNNVTEGVALESAPILRLLDDDGHPVCGERAIAFISHVGDVELTDYTPVLFLQKELINSISNVSDENGIVTFNNLTFSTSGPAEINHRINFVSGKTQSSSTIEIFVRTSMAHFKMESTESNVVIPYYVQKDVEADVDNTARPKPEMHGVITNENGEGLEEKQIECHPIDGKFLMLGFPGYGMSEPSGVITLKFSVTAASMGIHKLVCSVDGVTSDVITLSVIHDKRRPSFVHREAIGSVQTIKGPPSHLTIGQPMYPNEDTLTYKITDIAGQPLSGFAVTVYTIPPEQYHDGFHVFMDENSLDLVTAYPSAYSYLVDPINYAFVSDENGIVRFPNFTQIYAGFNGTVNLAAGVLLNSGWIAQMGSFDIIRTVNNVGRAEFISWPSNVLEGDTSANITVRVYMADGSPAVGIPVSLAINSIPFYGWYSYLNMRQGFSIWETLSPFIADDVLYETTEMYYPVTLMMSKVGTDSNGEYTFRNFGVRNGFAGIFTVALKSAMPYVSDQFTITVSPRLVMISIVGNDFSTNGTANMIEIGVPFKIVLNITDRNTGAPLAGYHARACLTGAAGTAVPTSRDCLYSPQIDHFINGISTGSHASDETGRAEFPWLTILKGPKFSQAYIHFWVGVHTLEENQPGSADYGIVGWSPLVTIFSRVASVSYDNSGTLPKAVSPNFQLPDFTVSVRDDDSNPIANAVVTPYFIPAEYIVDNGTSPLPFHEEYADIAIITTSNTTNSEGVATVRLHISEGAELGDFYAFFGCQETFSLVYGPITLSDKPIGAAVVNTPHNSIEVNMRWSDKDKPVGSIFVTGGAPLVGASVQMAVISMTGGGAILDPGRAIGVTNGYGLVTFDPIITSGPSGKYKILMYCGDAVSTPSDEFELFNPYELKVLTQPAAEQKITALIEPTLSVQLTSLSENAGINRKAIRVTSSSSGYTLSMDYIQYTDENGMLTLSGLSIADGNAGTTAIQFEIDGVIAKTSYFRVEDPRAPDLDAVSNWTNFFWIYVGICLPLFFGNSERQSVLMAFIGVLAAVGVTVTAYYRVFVIESEEWTNTESDTYIYLVMLAGCLILNVTILLSLYLWICIKAVAIKLGVFRRKFYSLYIKDSYYLNRLSTYRNLVSDSLPVGCSIHNAAVSTEAPVSEPAERQSSSFNNKCASLFGYNNFYYPQRFLFGACLSLFATFVEVLCVIVLIRWCNYYLDGLQIKLAEMSEYLDNKLDIINSSLETYNTVRDKVSTFDLPSVSTSELLALAYINSAWAHEFDRAQIYLTYSTTLGAILTFVVFIIIWILMFTRYRDRIMHMRHGDYFFIRENFNSFPAVYYVGLQAAHCILGYILICFLISTIIFVLSYDYVRNFLFQSLIGILMAMIGLTFFARLASKLLGSYVLMHDGRIRHLRLFTFVDLALVFLQVVSGIIEALLRFIVVTIISILVYIRLDISIVTRETQHYDPGHASYVGMILMDHMHNNPILVVFCDYLISEMKIKRKGAKERALSMAQYEFSDIISMPGEEVMDTKPRRVSKKHRNLMWLLVTLHNNPQLEYLRAHQLIIRQRASQRVSTTVGQPMVASPFEDAADDAM